MKKIILLLLVFGLTFPAYASKQEKAEELMRLTNTASPQVIEAGFDPLMKVLKCQHVLSQQDESKIKKDLLNALGMEEMQKALVSFWVDRYTEEELDEVLNFYRTKTGKKILALLPEYMNFTMAQGQKLDTRKLPEVMENISKKYPKRSEKEVEACVQNNLMK